MLDIPTLIVVTVATHVLAAVALTFSWRINRDVPAAGHWALGNALAAAALIAFLARGPMPLVLSVIVGNSLLTTATYVMWVGGRKIMGLPHPARPTVFVAALVVYISVMTVFTVIWDLYIVRSALSAVVFLVYCLAMIASFWPNEHKPSFKSAHALIYIYGFYGFFYIARIAIALGGGDSLLGQDFLISNPVTIITLCAAIVFSFASTICFVALCSEYVHHRLTTANREKDKLLRMIGHDLRGPFNIIAGFSELLANKVADGDLDGARAYGQSILAASRNANILLDNLLHWSTLQTGGLSPKPAAIDLARISRTAVDQIRQAAEARGIDVRQDPTPSRPARGDPDMITLSVRNLLDAAIKVTEPGGDVAITTATEDGRAVLRIALSASDSSTADLRDLLAGGAGAPPTPLASSPTGIGLPLVADMVAANGGDIAVDAPSGQGPTFTLGLPAAPMA